MQSLPKMKYGLYRKRDTSSPNFVIQFTIEMSLNFSKVNLRMLSVLHIWTMWITALIDCVNFPSDTKAGC